MKLQSWSQENLLRLVLTKYNLCFYSSLWSFKNNDRGLAYLETPSLFISQNFYASLFVKIANKSFETERKKKKKLFTPCPEKWRFQQWKILIKHKKSNSN